jgi:hypothetical protein
LAIHSVNDRPPFGGLVVFWRVGVIQFAFSLHRTWDTA